jgi:hypothetical protein
MDVGDDKPVHQPEQPMHENPPLRERRSNVADSTVLPTHYAAKTKSNEAVVENKDVRFGESSDGDLPESDKSQSRWSLGEMYRRYRFLFHVSCFRSPGRNSN